MRYTTIFIILLSISLKAYNQTANNICNNPLRESLNKLPEIRTNSKWFKVYSVGENVLAIVEPYNFEEAISYVILGKNKALLFDTGIGVDSISLVVKQLTNLPIIVINSHSHYDHIGGNYEFDNILALKTDFTLKHSKEGWNHEAVKHEVTQEAICLEKLSKFDTAKYSIRPYKISKFLANNDIIDLGDRKIKVIAVPGHTPDAIALLDQSKGYLWTGDTYYDGDIYLFAKETDLAAYKKSILKLSKIAPTLKYIFPSHNNPISQPAKLNELTKKFANLKAGKATIIDNEDNTIIFKYPYFGFKIKKGLL
jgi:glyoxylase-like metal-dependent hydrolase (beta-lactamase superfamily II)